MSREPGLLSGAPIFSLIAGKVWLSLPGQSRAIDLGDSKKVTYMMKDFLAQCALGEKLVSERSTSHTS